MVDTLHPELLHSYGNGYDFWLFDDCDSDDIGRWAMESWGTAEHATNANEIEQHVWFARACEYELERRSRPIVRVN
jgi:hypothetical protein